MFSETKTYTPKGILCKRALTIDGIKGAYPGYDPLGEMLF